MKKNFTTLACIAAILLGAITTSCSKKEESPEPTPTQRPGDTTVINPPPPPPPPPPVTDTAQLFTQNAWVTKKVYLDGMEQAGHFLIGSGYKFNNPNTYLFSLPGFPSASGTWIFAAAGKNKVELTNQGGTTNWAVLSISATNMTIEEAQSDGKVYKYDFEH
jgi:hypothetical protein